jgi:two-component system, LuxR family, response regulator FixJ
LSLADIVHIVDDDQSVRDSLCFLLESAGLVTRAHGSAEAFLAVVGDEPIGCVLTDVRMPGSSGLELQTQLHGLGIPAMVIVMTGHGEVPIAVAAMKNGAADFLEKPFDDGQLLAAVQRALAATRDARAHEARQNAAAHRVATLTPREREVLEGLLAGNGSKAIANHLGASPRTIEVHRTRVMAKLGVRSLPELVRLAQTAGLAPAA